MFCKDDLKFGVILLFLGITFLVLPEIVLANSISLGQEKVFFISSDYDISERKEITASLQLIGEKAYFYIDTEWLKSLDHLEKQAIKEKLKKLDFEFAHRIYPKIRAVFGSEWTPGIDNDKMITILVHEMKEGVGGYFNNADEYLKIEYPQSNEREMVYLSVGSFNSSLAKSFLAHEFVHLITFNQKERIRDVSEEVWLNEARAEYGSALVGYDNDYEDSNLQKRVNTFLSNPSDSLAEWQGKEPDYGALNLFIQYLVEQYGVNVLGDSLKSNKVGIQSINWALEKNGFGEDFAQAFVNWTIAILANDCDLGQRYCYQNENLKNLGVVPSFNILPAKGESTLGVTDKTKNWSGNWFQIIGGQGTLKLEFIGNPDNSFKVPYLKRDFDGNYALGFFKLDKDQRGEVLIPGFSTATRSVIIIPSIQTKTTNFLNPEPSFSYFWSASIVNGEDNNQEEDLPPYLNKPVSSMPKQEILDKIAEIEKILTLLREQLLKLAIIDGGNVASGVSPCNRIEKNLYFSLESNEVKCLQEFLKAQGVKIYPEGLVTGYFGPLTERAVIRFQEEYKEEILAPWGLEQGNGYVGTKTREKINFLLNEK